LRFPSARSPSDLYATATLFTSDGNTVAHRPPGQWVPDGLLAAYTAFVTALCQGTVPPHTAADHLRTLALATTAAEQANRDGAWIEVPATVPHARPGHRSDPEAADGTTH